MLIRITRKKIIIIGNTGFIIPINVINAKGTIIDIMLLPKECAKNHSSSSTSLIKVDANCPERISNRIAGDTFSMALNSIILKSAKTLNATSCANHISLK